MKYKIEKVENGYILEDMNHKCIPEFHVFLTLEALVNHIAYSLDEKQIGETIKFVIEKDE